MAQRIVRSGIVRLAATSSEVGTVAASGYIDIAGLALPLKSRRERITAAGGGAELEVRLSRSQLREARRYLHKGRHVAVRLAVVATDAAGNSAQVRAPVIRLRV